MTASTPPRERAAAVGDAGAGALLSQWRRLLQAAAVARAALAGVGVSSLVLAGARLAWGASLGDGGLPAVAALVAGFAVAGVMWWRSAAFALTPERTALWIEERDPRLRFALVTAAGGDIAIPVRRALERAIGAVPWELAARAAFWRSMQRPAALAVVGVVAALAAPAGEGRAGSAARPAQTGGEDTRAVAALGTVRLTVRPPRYSGLAVERFADPALVRAYPGSELVVEGDGDAATIRATVDSTALDVRRESSAWRALLTSGPLRALVRVERAGGDTRLLALEPLVDSAPVVTLREPARDTVLRFPRGRLTLAADLQDDLGLAAGAFEYIVSSGQGERFTFKSGSLGALAAGSGRRGTLRTTLSLDSLSLAPGDVVHLRAVARDRNSVSGPGVGSSESRTIRIARADEYDSVAVDQAPPPEVDKSILSQRMLINLTEALVKRARASDRAAVTAESRRIGRDQARLRKQVSDIIFARLGDGAEGAGEHFHGDGHGHDESERVGVGPLTPEALLRAAEKATQISGSPTDFEHDETPVVAINRPMLEAYNAMWDAGRALEVGEPARAIPPMYVALAAIQRARAAERLYLRGAPPRVVVDLAKVRLQGKDKGTPLARLPRSALDSARAPLLARFARALDALGGGASSGGTVAAIDTLIILRLSVAERLPVAASALEAAIGALRESRDATEELRRARRALDDALVAHDSLSAWGRLP